MRNTPLLLALVLGGCTTDTNVIEVAKKLEFGPGLTDLGDVIVGDEPVQFELVALNVQGNTIRIASVTAQDPSGYGFEFVGEVPIDVDPDASVNVPFTYTPVEGGYQQIDIVVLSDAEEPEDSASVRAHAVLGAARARPWVLDFGFPASSRELTVELVNDGPTDVTVFAAAASDADATTDLVAGTVIPVGGVLEVDVTLTVADTAPVDGTLTFDLGLVGDLRVDLRANDCESGDPVAYDSDEDGVSVCAGDCDDADDTIRPGGTEAANGLDDDCDGVTDEGTIAYDDDGDCMCEQAPCKGSVTTCTTTPGGDCADDDPAVHPGAIDDLGDGVDGNCDSLVDSGSSDVDGDGFSPLGKDCDDLDDARHPGAPEVPNGLDDDCDALVDEGTVAYDDDKDGTSEQDGDCDDGNPVIKPGAAEQPNWRDDDCDGTIDDGTVNADDDGDGFTENGGDCNDADPARNPGQREVTGNSVDEDCNGATGP